MSAGVSLSEAHPLLVNFGVDMVCVLLPNYQKIVHDEFV